MELHGVLDVAEYEQIATSFIQDGGVSSREASDEGGEELDQIIEKFAIIADEPDFLLVPEDSMVAVVVFESFDTLINRVIENMGKNLTLLALFGIVIKCLSDTLPSIILQSFEYKLHEILCKDGQESGYIDKISKAKHTIISLYASRISLLMISDYWQEFELLNSSFKKENFGSSSSFLYPSMEKYIQIAYIAGQFLGSALVKHYLNEHLLNH